MKNKVIKRIILLFAVIALLSGTAVAVDIDVFAVQSEAVDAGELQDALSGDSRAVLGDVGVTAGLSVDDALGPVVKNALSGIKKHLTAGLRSACVQLAVVMLCGVGGGVCDSAGSEAGRRFVPIAGALTLTAVSAGSIDALIGLGSGAISEMSSFSKLLLPTIAACAGTAGTPAAAVAKQLASALFSDVLITVTEKLLLPAVYIYVTLSVANACMEVGHLDKIAAFIKKAVAWILAAVLAAFTGYITLAGMVSGTADSFTAKAAKSVMSAVPVVGSVMSNASETIIAGAAILKNAVGMFGTAATIAVCAAPCIRMAVHYVFFKISAAVSSTIGDDKLVELIDALGGAVGLVLAMTASCALLIFISIISAVSVVS